MTLGAECTEWCDLCAQAPSPACPDQGDRRSAHDLAPTDGSTVGAANSAPAPWGGHVLLREPAEENLGQGGRRWVPCGARRPSLSPNPTRSLQGGLASSRVSVVLLFVSCSMWGWVGLSCVGAVSGLEGASLTPAHVAVYGAGASAAAEDAGRRQKHCRRRSGGQQCDINAASENGVAVRRCALAREGSF